MSASVFISTVDDGSMYNRNDRMDPEVINNRQKFLKKNDINTATGFVLHYNGEDGEYCRYLTLDEDSKGHGIADDVFPQADALVTTERNHALFLPVADCVGAVIYDPDHHVLMLSHLGRHSLEQQGGEKSVEYLVTHFESDPAKLEVWLTPAAGKDTYAIWKLDNQGMKEATLKQLLKAGIQEEHIIDTPAETTSDPRYYSYSEFLKGNRNEDGDHAIVAVMN